jgi:putative polyhydroxyalkanoate system protein
VADIDIKRTHALGLEGARVAAEKMEQALGRKFDLKGKWSGNTLSFERPGVSGTLDVGAKDVRLAVTLGFLLKAMKGSIERAVNEELDKLVATKPAAAAAKEAPAKPKKGPAPKKKGG